MTICVGVLCENGVVIATDTMFSNPVLGFDNRKLHNGENFICGISGDETWAKRLFHKLSHETYFKENDPYFALIKISTSIRDEFILLNPGVQNNVNDMLTRTGSLPMWPNLQSIIGFCIGDIFYLSSLSGGFCMPLVVKKEEKNFHNIIGSGYTTSAPLANLLIDILNIKNKPNVQEGKLLAYWLVKYAIDNASAYVGGNVEILTLSKSQEGTLEIQKEDACEELEETRQDILSYFRSYFSKKSENANLLEIPTI